MLVAVPGEFTTMAGRRLRDTVRKAILAAVKKEVQVILTGLSNAYSSYVSTWHEYQVQRYEGASTIYGPHTLQIYLEQYQRLWYVVIVAALFDVIHSICSEYPDGIIVSIFH